MPQILSCDWFQIGSKGGVPFSTLFEVKKLDYSTRHFKSVYEIFKDGKRIFTIAREPHSHIISPDHNLVKFDNKFLYTPNAIQVGLTHLQLLGLKPHNLSRIDLAIDFNNFKYGLKPEKLIRNYFTGDYVHNSHAKFTAIGNDNSSISYQYLRFGGAVSRGSIYLYNKSKELQEVKFKQYIHQKWIESGLDVTKDIWRLELSIQTGKMNITDRNTGEQIPFTIQNCTDNNFLTSLFWAGVNKYFSFKHKSNLANKSRWKDVDLFNEISPGLHIDFDAGDKDWTRADKIFIKKLHESNNEMRGTDFEFSIRGDEYLEKFARERDLYSWYLKKFSDS